MVRFFFAFLILSALLFHEAPVDARRGHAVGQARVGRVHGGNCPRGDVAYAGGQVVWCGYGAQRLATKLVWSKGRHAVAFATRGPRGVTLRVAMMHGRFSGTLLSWPLEVRRNDARAVMWLGRDRVGVGRSAVRPLLVASWRLRNL